MDSEGGSRRYPLRSNRTPSQAGKAPVERPQFTGDRATQAACRTGNKPGVTLEFAAGADSGTPPAAAARPPPAATAGALGGIKPKPANGGRPASEQATHRRPSLVKSVPKSTRGESPPQPIQDGRERGGKKTGSSEPGMQDITGERSSSGGSETTPSSGDSSDVATTSSSGSQASEATGSSSEREENSNSSGSEVEALGSSPQKRRPPAVVPSHRSDTLPACPTEGPRERTVDAVDGASPSSSNRTSSSGGSEEHGGADEQATGPIQTGGSKGSSGASSSSSGGSSSSSSSGDDKDDESDGHALLNEGGGPEPGRHESQAPPAKKRRAGKAAPAQVKAGAQQWVGVAPGRKVAQRGKDSIPKEPLQMWKATVRLPHSLGGGSLLLGSGFQSAQGAALAADRASIAVWGREGAVQRSLLNSPLEAYGPQERQLFGPELAAFLAQLRLRHSSYVPATERAAQAHPVLAREDGAIMEVEEREAGAAGADTEAAPQQAAPPSAAAHTQEELPPLLPFNPYEPCGCCPACRQPWLKERCWQLPIVHTRGPRKEFVTWIEDPRAAAEAQRQLELSQQRQLVKSVLGGTRDAFGRLGSKGTHKFEPVVKAAASAAGVTMEELAAAAAARHGISVEDAGGGKSQGEGEDSAAAAVEAYVRQVRVHPGPSQSAMAKVEAAQGSKRQRVAGGSRAGTGAEQQTQAQAGSGGSGDRAGAGSAAASEPLPAGLPWPLQLPQPPPTRLEWVQAPPRQSKVEKRLLLTAVQRRARQARRAEALQEAISALPARAPSAVSGGIVAAGAASSGAGDAAEGLSEAAAAEEGIQDKGSVSCHGSVANGGFGRGGGLLPHTRLEAVLATQPQPRLLRQVDSAYHRGAALHELQQGAYGESAVPPCVHCGGTHPGMRGLLDCPVWKTANTLELPERPPECPHCAQWVIPGCSRCLPEGAQLKAAEPNRRSSRDKRRKAGEERQAATQVAVPVRARAPWVAQLPPHTLDTLQAAQAVADAACADLSLPEAAGRFTPNALLACVLLAEAAVEARLKQGSAEGPPPAAGL